MTCFVTEATNGSQPRARPLLPLNGSSNRAGDLIGEPCSARVNRLTVAFTAGISALSEDTAWTLMNCQGAGDLRAGCAPARGICPRLGDQTCSRAAFALA